MAILNPLTWLGKPGEWTWRGGLEVTELLTSAAIIVCSVGAAVAEPEKKSWYIVPGGVFGILNLLSKLASKKLVEREAEERKNKQRTLAKRLTFAILEEIRKLHFHNGTNPDDWTKTRVTLFESVETDGQKPLLAIFSRAGVHSSSDRTWQMDADHPDNCRGGIAGKVWYHGDTLTGFSTCPWPADENIVECKKYADSLGLSLDEAKSLKVKSVAFLASQVRVNGRRWGIVVVDSSDPRVMPSSGQGQTKYKKYLDAYTKMIGRVIGEAES